MVPPWPAPPNPEQITEACPDGAVCLSTEFVVELGVWIRDAYRYHDVAYGCPAVKEAVMAAEDLQVK